ncbi:hypothetical protein FOFC_03568 [Fusarium oxysporum]|nr:hypothetical protein FOFC_03568 [Fusarium oxysporum]
MNIVSDRSSNGGQPSKVRHPHRVNQVKQGVIINQVNNARFKSWPTPQVYAEWGIRDDEIELVSDAH